MRRLCFFAIFSWLALSTSIASAQLTAIYDYETGGITFNDESPPIVPGIPQRNLAGIRLNSASSLLLGSEATDLDGAITGPLSVINDQAPNFIEWGNLLGFTVEDAFAGNLLPPGLSQAQLDADFELIYRQLDSPTAERFGSITSNEPRVLVPNLVSGSHIGLGPRIPTDGFLEDAITFTGTGALSSVSVANQSIPNLFFANLDGLSVDIGIDPARVTTFPAGTTIPEAVLTVNGDGGPWSYTLGLPLTFLAPTRAPGALDLGEIVAAGGLIEDALTFFGTEPIGSVLISNQSIPNLFFANVDGLSVDIGVDLDLATSFPAGTIATASIQVNGSIISGPFVYNISGVIPEPTTLGLAGLAMIGLIGARRAAN